MDLPRSASARGVVFAGGVCLNRPGRSVSRLACDQREAEWNWYTKDGQNVLYWHWSPNCGWAMDFEIRGYNECLVTYVLAASSPTYPIDPQVYHKGWAMSNFFKNGKEFYGHKLPLGFDYGGPLFFSHYSFMGLDPRGLKDRYADYWVQNQNHSLINYDYCVDNPKKYKGYGANCWGLFLVRIILDSH